MWLIVLIIITALFLGISLYISDYDIMHPSVVFNLFFGICELICLLFKNEYSIELHPNSVVVIILGEFVFLIMTVFSRTIKSSAKCNYLDEITVAKIEVKKELVIGLIMCQLISIAFFIMYIRAISLKYVGSASSLGSMINVYDQANKFFKKELATIPIPLAYRLLNPINIAGSHVIVYILINNWVAEKKVDPLHLASSLLLVFSYVLNGSRTPIFRLITLILIQYYILYFKRKNKRINTRFIIRLFIIAVVTIILMFLILIFAGRLSEDSDYKYTDFIFVYLGAPIVNLDNWLANPEIYEEISWPGVHVFGGIYSFLADTFHLDSLHFQTILVFKSSESGKFLGNVYTMFYSIVYDFGIIGIIPVVGIMGAFYCFMYDRMFHKQIRTNTFNMKLFVYSYMFNDLIMSIFSTRFFETILDRGVIRIFILAYILEKLFLEEKLPFFSKHLRITKFRVTQ